MALSPPPHLPQDDPAPAIRDKKLADAREAYQWDHSYRGYALVKDVPKGDEFDVGYLAKAAKVKVALAANKAAAGLSHWAESETESLGERLKGLFTSGRPRDVVAAHRASAQALHEGGKKDHPMTVAQYDDLYPAVPKPASAAHWRQDWYFAWQRVAGCNPILLERVTEMPDHFPVTDEHLAASVEGDSLDAAREQGRLFLVDFPMFDGVALGETDGRQKYLDAPMLLMVRSTAGPLVPVAIQGAQRPSAEHPIYTPRDGEAWQMAKMVVQVADANFQGVISHLGYCHLVMESVIVAAHRNLAPNHPLMLLLEPHFQFTLATNAVAREQLINPGGNMDRLQSGTLDASTELVQSALRDYAFDRSDAPSAWADRGVDDREALPDYPFRDDGMESYEPIRRFVEGYVRLYYGAADAVAGDGELQAWVRAMGSEGKLHRVVGDDGVRTVEDLCMLVTRVLYKCTTYHAGINYPSWDFLGYPPCMPAAGWGPGPSPTLAAGEEALTMMMTPLDLTFETMDLMLAISVHDNRLGEYPPGQFRDGRVAPLVKTFADELEAAEKVIAARNETRRAPYPYLLPSQVPRSIHV